MAAGPRGYHATHIQQAVDAQPGNMGQRVTGRLRKIHKAMGFCSVEGIDGHVLLGERNLNEAGVDLTTMQIGDALEFDMHQDLRGYHATDILPHVPPPTTYHPTNEPTIHPTNHQHDWSDGSD